MGVRLHLLLSNLSVSNPKSKKTLESAKALLVFASVSYFILCESVGCLFIAGYVSDVLWKNSYIWYGFSCCCATATTTVALIVFGRSSSSSSQTTPTTGGTQEYKLAEKMSKDSQREGIDVEKKPSATGSTATVANFDIQTRNTNTETNSSSNTNTVNIDNTNVENKEKNNNNNSTNSENEISSNEPSATDHQSKEIDREREVV